MANNFPSILRPPSLFGEVSSGANCPFPADSIGLEPLPDSGRTRSSAIATANPTSDQAVREGSGSARSERGQIDPSGAFLAVSQTNSRQLEDDLERGVIGTLLGAETEPSPWLDLGALTPRTKLIVTLVVLAVVLLGAISKLIQTILSSSSTH
ncbi:hypothetical protein FRC00_009594 [Tulasnella sp. 408]|nr:hypothetical protein FRC00_009594 [Tulasnella sp. 408]